MRGHMNVKSLQTYTVYFSTIQNSVLKFCFTRASLNSTLFELVFEFRHKSQFSIRVCVFPNFQHRKL
jgi:hypothetical protein